MKKKQKANRRRTVYATGRFKTLADFPSTIAANGMHPETRKIIGQIARLTRGKTLAYTAKDANAAKTRMKAIRNAHKKKRVTFTKSAREAEMLYFEK